MRRVDRFTQANVSAANFNKSLVAQAQIYQRTEAAANAYRAEQQRLDGLYKDLKNRQMEFIDAGRYGELKPQLRLGLIKDKLVEMKSPLVRLTHSGIDLKPSSLVVSKSQRLTFPKAGAMIKEDSCPVMVDQIRDRVKVTKAKVTFWVRPAKRSSTRWVVQPVCS